MTCKEGRLHSEESKAMPTNTPYSKPLRGDRCQCQGCYEYFNSTAAFDKHRIGKRLRGQVLVRRCLRLDEMRALGMSQNEAGFWVSRARPKSLREARTVSVETAIS